MKTQEIPRNDWAGFFDRFSWEHEEWLVTVDVLGEEIGAQIEALEMPLEGFTFERATNHRPTITITLGRSPDCHLTHSIVEPVSVHLEQTDNNADVAVQILDASGITTLVRFRTVMRSERVDAVAMS